MRKILASLMVGACLASGTALSADAVAPSVQVKDDGVVITTTKTARGGASTNFTVGWSWGGPAVFFNKGETKSARSFAGAAALCGLVPGIPVFKVLCGLQASAIQIYANKAYDSRKCLMVYVTPGLIIPSVYKGKECN